jgi:hypothetical protein
MIVYDQQFNLNEIFVLIMLSLFFLLKLLPARFSKKVTILILLYSPFMATIFDNLIGIQRINYYDINDTSFYDVFDVLLYIGYAPIGYIFIYIYDKYFIRKVSTVLYIFIWSLIAVITEFIAEQIGVFHYLNGYTTFISFPIYLFIQVSFILFYHWIVWLEKEDEAQQTF